MTIMKTSSIAIALGILGIFGTAAADSFTPTDDAMIFANSSGSDTGNANGRGPGMFAGADGQRNIKRALVKFDLSSLPTTTVATQVELDLVIGQIAGSGGQGPGCGTNCNPASRTFDMYVVDYSKTWHEGQTGATACGGGLCSSIGGTGQGWSYTTCNCDDVTWAYNDYKSGASSSWANSPSNQDYGSAVIAATFDDFLNNATEAFIGNGSSNTAFLNAVNNWIANPSQNNGFEIRAPDLEGTATSFIGWWTKDGATANSNSALSPVLIVTH
jgi:hypothetical protein